VAHQVLCQRRLHHVGWLLCHLRVLLSFAFCTGKHPDHTAINVPMFQPGSEDKRKILGDATDSGLLRYCDRLSPSSLVRMAYKKVSPWIALGELLPAVRQAGPCRARSQGRVGQSKAACGPCSRPMQQLLSCRHEHSSGCHNEGNRTAAAV
jgi:hypothetical protein